VVNTNNVYNATRGGPSYSAYLTYSHPRESAIAILVSIRLLHSFKYYQAYNYNKITNKFYYIVSRPTLIARKSIESFIRHI